MRIEEAEEIVLSLKLAALCMPTPSHTEENHRFRLIFPLVTPISNPLVYKMTYSKLAEHFPVDKQTSDLCRFYFGCKQTDGFWIEGDLIVPEEPEVARHDVFDKTKYNESTLVLEDTQEAVRALYGVDKEKIPEQVDYFLRNAHTGLEGEWHSSFNSFIFTLSLQGVGIDTIAEVASSLAPDPLDDHDLYLLERAHSDAQEKREVFDKPEEKRYSSRRRRRS